MAGLPLSNSDGVFWLEVRTARAQWIEEEEGGVDDCTAIVCYLAWGKPDVAEGTSGGSGALHGKMLSSVTSISRRAMSHTQKAAL